MSTKQQQSYTREEYLLREERAAYKSEYRQGDVVAMAGTSVNHNRIAGNLVNALSNILESKQCEVFISDLRLWVANKNLYTYPDVMVVCGGPDLIKGQTDTITNPKIIIEVLSKSTESYDRGDKFQAYRTLDTIEDYVLVDQYRVYVEYFRKAADNLWELEILTQVDQSLTLNSIDVDIPLIKIYHNVLFEE